ncbi:MAG: enolase C-terminal domain-like protein, partial [Candidatus Poribacteria bacterium]
MPAEAVRLRVNDVRYYMRNVRLRMPFRYGVAQLIGYPILHVRVDIETADGTKAEGVAADCLPPKWFDKDQGKSYEDNIDDMLAAVAEARDATVGMNGDARTPFELFREGLATVTGRADSRGFNQLTAAFGSSFFERAVVDAVGNALGLAYHEIVRENVLGVRMGEVHAELAGLEPRDVVGDSPLPEMWVRHTVGLSDPILDGDIAADDRLNDGLPQSLEEYVARQGLRYFKIKVCGDHDVDLPRLRAMAGLLDSSIEGAYIISLDGNEQYREIDSFVSLVDELRTAPEFSRFFDSIRYIEQPMARDVALDADVTEPMTALSHLKPVIVDESDSDLNTFKQAIAVGYRGVSAKNCKGIYKSLLNQALAQVWTKESRDGRPYFLTGEDLANAAIVPLHQDLATLATLGIDNAERNGHHYLRGLTHLSEGEQAACLEAHPALYATRDGVPQL